MTVFKLFHPNNLDNSQEVSEYFRIDADYLEGFLETTGGDFEDIASIKSSVVEKLQNSEELSERESLLLTAVFVGDAEWLGPNSEWYNRPLRYFLQLGDGFAHHEWFDVAKQYGDISKVTLPQFSEPENFDVNGENPTYYVSNLYQRANLVASVMQLEWCLYVCNQMEIDTGLDHDKVMMEGIEYFVGERETLSEESARVHRRLFLLDQEWLRNVTELFDIRSFSMWWFQRRFNSTATELEQFLE